MPASYRQQARAQARREQVAILYCKGTFQTAIARQLGISQQQVSLDLKILREQWLASALRAFDAAKAQELQKLDVLEREAWEAWERSKGTREITITEQTEGGEVPGAPGRMRAKAPTRRASVRREGGYGDARFLEQIQKCIERRCALLGLNAPQQVDMRMSVQHAAAKVAAELGLTSEEVLAEAQAFLLEMGPDGLDTPPPRE